MHPAKNTVESGQMEACCLWALQAGQGDISGIDKGEQLTVVASGAAVVVVVVVVASGAAVVVVVVIVVVATTAAVVVVVVVCAKARGQNQY